MVVKRSRLPISVDKYLQMKGKIVSRKDGLVRQYIDENFVIKNGSFVSKSKLDSMIEAGKAPAAFISKDPSEDREAYLQNLSTNLGFIQELTTSTDSSGQFAPTRFSSVQGFLMNADDPFLWTVKTRQFGFSFVLAARSLAKAMLKPKHTSIFVSYNEEESKEKIVFAKELYDSMPIKWRLSRKLKYDNKTSLVFEKAGQNSSETRILSYPQRIIRGKGGEIDIGLDEFAHCIHSKKIYTSAIPALSRSSNSQLWVGSSPAGKGGLFYEIGINQDMQYAPYVRLTIPWWIVPEFCTDTERAGKEAWDMHTDQRVELFATERLKLIRNSMTLDDFRQEYECEYLDELYSYFPWDLINSCVPIFNVDANDMPDYDSPGSELSENDRPKSGVGIEHYDSFEEFINAVRNGKIKGNILGGFDVGRTTDASEIYYLEENPDTCHQVARCNITLKNVKLPDQRRIVKEQFELLGRRLTRFGIDYNGIGRNIAEDLEELSYETVVKLNFNSNAWKEEACRRFKFRMEKKGISLATKRQVLTQIHSIKRILLPGGLWRFDTEKNEKHHGDKFWGLLAASEVGKPIDESQGYSSFDERIMIPKKDANKRKTSSVIMVADSAKHLSKYSPWQSILPGVPSMFNLPKPGSSFEDGLTPLNNQLIFRR